MIQISQEKVNEPAFPKSKLLKYDISRRFHRDDKLICLTSSKHNMTNDPHNH